MTRRVFRHAALPLLVTLGLAASGPQAQTSPYYLALSQSVGNDNNLLRLGIDEPTPDGFSRSDSFSTTSLLAGFNQPFGRQRAYANATVRDTRYGKNDVFDNRGYSLRAGLDWATIERVSGSVNVSANRSLQRFNSTEIGFLREKNLETVRNFGARVSVGLVTEYSLEVTAGHSEVRNSLQTPNVQAREFSQDNALVSLRWRPSGITSVGLGVGSTRGRYPKFRSTGSGFEADRFKRDDFELTASYRASGASNLEARISTGKTVYDLNQQRNFSGITGNLVWTWQPTGKLVFNTAVTRDTGQESYATSVFNLPALADYSRDNTIARVQAEYNFSAKLAFTASVTHYQRNVVRTIDNPFLPLEASGRERTALLALGARWAPLRSVQAGCDLNREDRRAQGQLVVSLRGTNFSCYGQLSLQ